MWREVSGLLAFCACVGLPAVAHAEGSSSGSSQRAWGWVATGAGLAFLGVGTYAYFAADSYADDPAYEDYRKTEVPAGEDACKYAESKGRDDIVDVCDGNEDWKTVFWISVPVGLAVTGTGIYLLATAPSEPAKAGWQLSPRTSPHGGRIDLTYRF